jgi:hypothetical protein
MQLKIDLQAQLQNTFFHTDIFSVRRLSMLALDKPSYSIPILTMLLLLL